MFSDSLFYRIKMKQKLNHLKVAALLVFAIGFSSFNFGTEVTAQDTKRQRVVEKPTPTPKPTATPKQTPTITPTPIPSPTATPASVQTLNDLQSRIRLALTRSELQRGQVGVKIVSLDTNKTIFEQNAEKYFMPASNMKNFTVATALERLTPDFRFITSVFSGAKPDANGVVKGLSVYGRGDVSYSTSFYENDYYKNFDALAAKIAQAGVKKIEGDLVGDDSYFSGFAIPAGWEWDDLQWYDGAEVSALPFNDNIVDLSVKPSSGGAPCAIQVQPFNPVIKIVNNCTTSAPGAQRQIRVYRKFDQNVLEVSGTMPANDKGYAGKVTFTHAAELFVALLRQALEKKGVVITGQARAITPQEVTLRAVATSLPPVEIARLESPPLSFIAAKTMKPSQNMYTETILWTLGAQMGNRSNPNLTTSQLGLGVVQGFLSQIGIPSDGIVQYDGSGLSRHNLVTPSSVVQLYTYMARQSRYAQIWRDSLTIAGVDGTLRSRFKGTIAAGNVRGKTGTLDQVSALSGYVTTAAGENLVFSIIVNGVPDRSARVSAADDIVIALANFNGRTN